MAHTPSRTPAPGTAAPPPRANAVVAVLAFGGIVVATMQTLVIPIVPLLPQLLHASAADAAWAVTATLLAAAVATPVTGRLGDMFGKRRMLLVSLVMLVAGSVTAGLSDTLAPMVAGRALQGLAAGVIPLGISIMRDELPAERLASATAVMSASLGVGGALGLPAAALIAEHWNWHMLFWISGGLGAVATGLVLAFVPEARVRTGGRFDLVGAAGMATGLVCLLLAVSKGADWGWSSGTTLGLFGAAVVVLLLWGVFELRTEQPLVDLRTTARRQVLFTNLASIALGFAMFAMSLVLPQLLQMPEAVGYGLGQSLLSAGLVMAPSGLVMLALAPVSAALSRARGPKITLIVGALIVAVGYGLNIVLMAEVWQLVLVSCVIGGGIGFTYGAMPALIMGAVPPSETGAANSLNTLMRSIGTSTASAVAGVVLAGTTIPFGPTSVPSQDGFRTVLAVGGGAAVLSALLAAFLPRQRKDPAAKGGPETAEGAGGPGDTAPAVDAPGAGHGAEAPATTGQHGAHVPDGPAGTCGPDGPYDALGPHTGLPGANGSHGTYDPPGAYEESGADSAVPAGVPVTGRVLTPEGAPLPGAAVTLTSPAGRQLGRAVAQRDGGYAVHAPGAGSYVLIASADGCCPQATTVAVAALPVAHDLRLTGTSGLAGVVSAAGTGAAVQDATVVVTDASGDVLATGKTDVHGEFAITGLAPGTVTAAVSSGRHRPLARPVEIGHGHAHTRVELTLEPGAHVRGTVTGEGAPLNGALVTLADPAGNLVASARTGADGAYAFSDLDHGDYTITATGYPPKTAPLLVTGHRIDDHDIELVHDGA